MLRKRTGDCREITANDGCRLREILHPDRDGVDVPYSLAVARVEPGGATLPHRLLAQSELYWILEGRGTMHVGDASARVEEGEAILVPPGVVQWIENSGSDELRFTVTVSPPWRAEDDVREGRVDGVSGAEPDV